MKKIHIVLYALLTCGILYYIEQGVGISYGYKAALKVILFLVIPLFMLLKSQEGTLRHIIGIDHVKFKDIKRGLLIGAGAFIGMVLLAFIFHQSIDFESIRIEIDEKLHVTKTTFVFVGLYITLVNSLLEELFFRGFIFLTLHKAGGKKLAMWFSAILFGCYHMAMFQTWFPPALVLLCVVGLVAVGLFFNWINLRTKTFLNSWLVHIIADAAIMIIGFRMLYL